MTVTLLILIFLHIVLFHLDEYYFHRKRPLTRKEVISMFVDGLLFLPPLMLAIFTTFSEELKILYIVLASLSCLSIVKNECFMHSGICRKERLLHSLLYVLHPILLFSFYLSWERNYFVHNINFWIVQVVYLGAGLRTLAHQLIYWNYIRENSEKLLGES
jgi:hypothetical protein